MGLAITAEICATSDWPAASALDAAAALVRARLCSDWTPGSPVMAAIWEERVAAAAGLPATSLEAAATAEESAVGLMMMFEARAASEAEAAAFWAEVKAKRRDMGRARALEYCILLRWGWERKPGFAKVIMID